MRRGHVCRARRVGGSAAQPAPPRAVQRAVWKWRRVGRAPCRRRGDRSTRGDDDAGAHARHMRRRTSGLRQLTPPPRPISRLSSASLPSLAASYTALPIESLIAAAALYRPSPAWTPADWGGGTRGSAVTLERRRRALSRGVHAARPHAPRSSGGRGGRGARARRGRSKRPRRAVEAAATPGSRGPEQVVWACEAAGEAGHRARRGHWVMRARTRGLPDSRPAPLSYDFYKFRKLINFGGSTSLYETVCAYRYSVPVKRHRGSRFGIA